MASSHRMMVPRFWAEARVQHKEKKKQVTVRRFGWSDTSQEDAQTNAESRAQEALQKLLSGERLLRREPKVAYNGAHGTPIREEIISTHGDTVITRNSYGARCLNTPNVLFADIDYERGPTGRDILIALALSNLFALTVGILTHSVRYGLIIAFLSIIFCFAVAGLLQRIKSLSSGGPQQIARKRIDTFLASHPDWKLRLYQTPAGMRVMVMHRPFDPNDPAVLECFKALGTDKIYMRMCMNQQCFRARVSAKPWRIGIDRQLSVRGVWPVSPDRMPIRAAWIEKYEAAAQNFAACHFLESLGQGIIHPDVAEVQQLHDELCRANTQLPVA